jgi:hypothetical protein
METTSAITFKRTSLAGYREIKTPGTYELEVSNNVSEKNLFEDENGRQRYIVGFKAIASDKLPQLREVFGNSPEVAIESTNGLFLTGSIWKNGESTPALPMKGEKAKVTIDWVNPREAAEGEVVLRITNIQVQAAKTADKLSLETLFAPVPEGEMAHQ